MKKKPNQHLKSCIPKLKHLSCSVTALCRRLTSLLSWFCLVIASRGRPERPMLHYIHSKEPLKLFKVSERLNSKHCIKCPWTKNWKQAPCWYFAFVKYIQGKDHNMHFKGPMLAWNDQCSPNARHCLFRVTLQALTRPGFHFSSVSPSVTSAGRERVHREVSWKHTGVQEHLYFQGRDAGDKHLPSLPSPHTSFCLASKAVSAHGHAGGGWYSPKKQRTRESTHE